MIQRHPLTTLSLTPFGFVFPYWQTRLDWRPPPKTCAHWVNQERLILCVWDRRHRLSAPRPFPVQTIVHTIVPTIASKENITSGDFDFDGLPYLTRDILVLSSVVQWFGTGVGGCFLTWKNPEEAQYPRHLEFKKKFDAARSRSQSQLDLVRHVVHQCTSRCSLLGHDYGLDVASKRDRVIVEGLMLWLGTDAGRAFIAAYMKRKDKLWNAARSKRIREMAVAGAA